MKTILNVNGLHTLFLALAVATSAMAQDMPLSQVLIEGEDWQVVSEGHAFTDGAAADAYGGFYFTDVKQGTTINQVAPDGETVTVFAKGAPSVSGLQFGPDGRLYACQGGPFGRIVAFDKGRLMVIAENVKPNDLVVTAYGGIYFTETSKQQVTYIAPGGQPVAVDMGIGKPNGIALSPDQGTLAVSDYGGEHVWVWRIENDGILSFKQPYMTLRTPGKDMPSKGDGMATDAAGRYYVTSAVGLQMFDPTGRLSGVIRAPQDKPLVSVEFAGPAHSYLYVACGDRIYRRKTKTQGVLYFQDPLLRKE